jgi:hypothetical protein
MGAGLVRSKPSTASWLAGDAATQAVIWQPGGFLKDLFGADALLPSQIAQRPRSGEYDLLVTVLEDAVWILVNGRKGARSAMLRAETVGWFLSEDTTRLFCFASICEHLGIAPEYLRDGLRKRELLP